MTDPTEEALRAIEAKYLRMTGAVQMPLYPREDVRLMIEAAVQAEREACAKIAEGISTDAYFAGYGPADERPGPEVTGKVVAAAIRARKDT